MSAPYGWMPGTEPGRSGLSYRDWVAKINAALAATGQCQFDAQQLAEIQLGIKNAQACWPCLNQYDQLKAAAEALSYNPATGKYDRQAGTFKPGDPDSAIQWVLGPPAWANIPPTPAYVVTGDQRYNAAVAQLPAILKAIEASEPACTAAVVKAAIKQTGCRSYDPTGMCLTGMDLIKSAVYAKSYDPAMVGFFTADQIKSLALGVLPSSPSAGDGRAGGSDTVRVAISI